MTLRFGSIAVCFVAAFASSAVADDHTEKLDLILKELKQLNQRVSRLEQQMRKLAEAPPAQANRRERSLDDAFRRVITPPARPALDTPAEIIRLQTESPGLLMKGIHERERRLRQRHFPAELFVTPPRAIPFQP